MTINPKKNPPKLFGLIIIIISLLAVSCTAQPAAPQDDPTNLGDEEDFKRLRIFNWDTYMDPDILTAFEEEFDVTIEYDLFDNNEDMLEQLEAGAVYDVIVPSDYVVEYMRAENLLYPIDHDNIPNIENLAPSFASPIFDPGNRYCVAYQWGTIGIGYNSANIDEELTGFADLLNPEYAGRIAMLDDVRSTLGITLIYLGYSPNSSNPDQIQEATQLLQEHEAQFLEYAPDTGQDLLLDGTVDIALEWSGDIFQAIEEDPNIKYVIPSEGSIAWTDNLCIPKNASNPELAEQFVNFILDAAVGAQLSNFVRYATPNQASMPMILEEDQSNPAIYPSEQVRKRLFFLSDVEDIQLFDEAWATLVE